MSRFEIKTAFKILLMPPGIPPISNPPTAFSVVAETVVSVFGVVPSVVGGSAAASVPTN